MRPMRTSLSTYFSVPMFFFPAFDLQVTCVFAKGQEPKNLPAQTRVRVSAWISSSTLKQSQRHAPTSWCTKFSACCLFCERTSTSASIHMRHGQLRCGCSCTCPPAHTPHHGVCQRDRRPLRFPSTPTMPCSLPFLFASPMQVVGTYAPESSNGAVVTVRTISHEEADAQVELQRKGQAKPARRSLSSMTDEEKPSLMRVSHAVLLVEAWEVVGQQVPRPGNVQVAVEEANGAASKSSNSSEARPGERSLQAVVTDLPRTDPRQCIYPS